VGVKFDDLKASETVTMVNETVITVGISLQFLGPWGRIETS
jgi:hypothetical protein